MAIATPTGTRTFFARRLRELRIPRGFRTARSLAQELGIDENRYTRYERAEVEPDLDLLVRISEVLEITPNDLLGVFSQPDTETGFAEVDTRTMAKSNHGIIEIGSAGDHPEPSAETERWRRQSQAWALAREMVLTADSAALDTTYHFNIRTSGTLAQLQRITHLFQLIEANPFAFVADLSTSPLLAELSIEHQERFAKLAERVVTSQLPK
ncbi:MAG: Helix-turn-helix domain [Pseudomonadota bacterium]|jgi:transcriptional regulator with XRE-family HTH domain